MTRRHTTEKAVVSHYLLSLALDCCAHMHAYLMTDDKRYLGATAEKMLSEAEKLGCHPRDGLMLATPITTDVEAVRNIILKRSPDAEELFRAATDFHWSIFMTDADDPDTGRLMAMH